MYSPSVVVEQHSDTVNCLAFSPDGLYLASGDDSGLVVVSKTPALDDYDRFHFCDSITALLWIPGSLELFVGLANCELHFLSLSKGRSFSLQLAPEGYSRLPQEWKALFQLNCLAFEPNSRLLAVGVGTSTVIVSAPDSDTLMCCNELTIAPFEDGVDLSDTLPEGLAAEVRSLDFINNTHLLVTYLQEGIRCYDVHLKKELFHIKPQSFRIGRSALDKPGRFLLSSNLYNGFDLYDTTTQQHVRNIPQEIQPDLNFPLPALFVDGNATVLLGSTWGEVYIQSLNADVAQVILKQDSCVTSALAYTKISETLSYIAASSSDGFGKGVSVKIWVNDTADRRPPKRTLVSKAVATEAPRSVKETTSAPKIDAPSANPLKFRGGIFGRVVFWVSLALVTTGLLTVVWRLGEATASDLALVFNELLSPPADG